MASLEINVGGVQIMSRQLARYIDRVQDLRPALEQIAKDIAVVNRENFATQGASGVYGRWAPLSPAYRVWKERNYPGQPILVRTGHMRDQLTKFPLGLQETTMRSIKVGTALAYAGYHQTGTAKMPRRQPVSLTEQMRRDMMKTLQRWVVSGTLDVP